jgi:hypothetical protein
MPSESLKNGTKQRPSIQNLDCCINLWNKTENAPSRLPAVIIGIQYDYASDSRDIECALAKLHDGESRTVVRRALRLEFKVT